MSKKMRSGGAGARGMDGEEIARHERPAQTRVLLRLPAAGVEDAADGRRGAGR